MPIRVQNDLPVKEILEKENIFVMDENRAVHQDIRPIKIGLLNLMPLKEDTELQLLRSLSNTPLQVDIVFLAVKSHVSKNTSANHLNRFYENFENVKDQKFDGFIITGAPVEQMPFEEVDYWEELCRDHGVDKDACYFNDPSLLGSTGSTLLSLWDSIKYSWTKSFSVSLNIRL